MLVKFEQNRMVRPIKIFELFDKKWLIIFFQYFKSYGSPTRVTRLNVAPNMADPISPNEKRQKSGPKFRYDDLI